MDSFFCSGAGSLWGLGKLMPTSDRLRQLWGLIELGRGIVAMPA